jgi:hypothetical protein
VRIDGVSLGTQRIRDGAGERRRADTGRPDENHTRSLGSRQRRPDRAEFRWAIDNLPTGGHGSKV